ncbi:16897_t:CDS:2, partial [Acaulospora colombiana]
MEEGAEDDPKPTPTSSEDTISEPPSIPTDSYEAQVNVVNRHNGRKHHGHNKKRGARAPDYKTTSVDGSNMNEESTQEPRPTSSPDWVVWPTSFHVSSTSVHFLLRYCPAQRIFEEHLNLDILTGNVNSEDHLSTCRHAEFCNQTPFIELMGSIYPKSGDQVLPFIQHALYWPLPSIMVAYSYGTIKWAHWLIDLMSMM